MSCGTLAYAFQDMTVDQIIAGNESAVGGADAIKQIMAIRLSTDTTLGSPSASNSMVITMQRPNLSRVETTSQGLALVSGFDGSNAWSVDPHTGIATQLTLDPSSSGNLSSFQIDSLVGYLRGIVASQTAQLIGGDELNGVKVYHIKATRADGTVFDYFIDQATFLITKTSIQVQQAGTTQTVESYPADYRKVNGITVPYSLDVRVAGQSVFTMQVQKAELNPVIDDSIFKMPSTGTAAPKQ
jgi:outer membrane lipoprotein-sorting protein